MSGGRIGGDWQDAEESAFKAVLGELMVSSLSKDQIELGLVEKGFCLSHTETIAIYLLRVETSAVEI
ncbi:MAG: hypothetical protein GX463_07980 [Methanothrix sp.]|nr:hypothetical protein [Methanothrix sp.]